MASEFSFVFNSMPIDAYFDYACGRLSYRSLRFETFIHTEDLSQGYATINRTDTGTTVTRETYWHRIPGHQIMTGHFACTHEAPCAAEDNGDARCYRARTVDGRYERIYQRYTELAADQADRMRFIGRCGRYRYLDIQQVIMQSLQVSRRWLTFGIALPRRRR